MITAAKVDFARVQLELWNCLRRAFISGMFKVEKAVSRLITNSVALMMVFPTMICDKSYIPHNCKAQKCGGQNWYLLLLLAQGCYSLWLSLQENLEFFPIE